MPEYAPFFLMRLTITGIRWDINGYSALRIWYETRPLASIRKSGIKEMKIIAIGDIHGRRAWKDIVMEHECDKVVFVGDYFDSFYIDGNTQLNNFLDIIEYKKANPGKVRLLLGNHDFHYLPGVFGSYSGYNAVFSGQFREKLNDAIRHRLIKICWFKDGIMFSHAGISKEWLAGPQRKFDANGKSVNWSIFFLS